MIRHNGIEIDREAETISHAGYTYRTVERRPQGGGRTGADIQFKVLQALILTDEGMTRGQMFDHVYGDHEDGGPITGPSMMCVRFNQWRPIFEALSLKLERTKKNGWTHYRLKA